MDGWMIIEHGDMLLARENGNTRGGRGGGARLRNVEDTMIKKKQCFYKK
jgi:hypothetical protein